MVKDSVTTISGNIDEATKHEVDLDEALSIAGFGRYNIKYSLNLALFLIAVIVEPVGYSFVLPSAKCDLDMSDAQRGFVGSIPYIGIVLTSFPWGYLVDTQGRKKMVIYSSLGAGVFSALSAFMPNLVTFTLFKFLSSLCIACPSSVPYSFIGEILPLKYRDITLSVTNAMQITGSVLVPLIAWAILPLDFSADFGLYYFRPWRLLTIVYSSLFIISAIFLSFGPESPKYLISQGKHDESLEVLKKIYAGNKGKSPEDYPVRHLKIPEESKKEKQSFLKALHVQSVPLMKPPYIKWMCLNSILFFGIFATLNGLYIWLPDVLNQVFSGDAEDMTACDIISRRLNELEIDEVCIDTLDPMIFSINSIANISCAVIALALSSTVKFIGKKVLLVFVFTTIGTFIMLINVVKQKILFAILLSSIPVMGLTIGPINAFSVEIFPTSLRGMAIGLTMMIGRAGSVVGTNVAGVLLNAACEITFYGFGGSLVLCALLSLLLPRAKA